MHFCAPVTHQRWTRPRRRSYASTERATGGTDTLADSLDEHRDVRHAVVPRIDDATFNRECAPERDVDSRPAFAGCEPEVWRRWFDLRRPRRVAAVVLVQMRGAVPVRASGECVLARLDAGDLVATIIVRDRVERCRATCSGEGHDNARERPA